MADTSLGFDIFARDRASGVFNRVGRSAQTLESRSSGLGGAFTSLGGKVLEFGKMAAVGAGIAAVGAISLGVKTAASLEQAQVAFSTLLGSSQKAEVFLGQLKTFAAKTPFELPGLIDASRQLLGVGQSAQSVIPTLTAWGDAAGALGLSQEAFQRTMLAVTQSMANGKIQAGDMLQITQAGIPIWSLMARALGMPVSKVRQLSEQGKLLTKDVLPKLQAQMEKDYGGSMAKQSQTLNGVWSTLMDTLKIGLAQAVQPLLPILKTAIPIAANVLSVALKGLSKGFLYVINGAKALAKFIGPNLKGSSKQGSDVLKQFKTLVTTVFKTVSDWYNKNRDTVNRWGKEIGQTVKLTLQAVSGIIQILTLLWKNFGADFIQVLSLVFGHGLDSVRAVMMEIKGIIDIALGLLTGDWRRAWKGIQEIVRAQILMIKSLIHEVMGLIKVTVSATMRVVRSVFGGAWRNMTGQVRSAYSSIVSRVTSMLAKIRSIGSSVRAALSGAGSWLYNAGRAIINGLIKGINNALGGLRGLLNKVTSWIPSWKGPPEKDRKLLVPAGQSIMRGLIGGIQGQVGALKSTLGGVTETIGAQMIAPNPALAVAAGGGSRGSGGGRLEIEWVGGNAGDEFLRWLRRNIRIRGGSGPDSVQKALGGL